MEPERLLARGRRRAEDERPDRGLAAQRRQHFRAAGSALRHASTTPSAAFWIAPTCTSTRAKRRAPCWKKPGWEIVESKTTVMPLELVLGLRAENPLMRADYRDAGILHRRVSRAARISARVSGEAARVKLRLAAPAIFLASLLLLPFLNKPFTIDDALFLREAKHALVDPLHPADFEQVWNAGDRLKLSQYLLGGTLPAYVLAPVAALGGKRVDRAPLPVAAALRLPGGVSLGGSPPGLRQAAGEHRGLLVAANPVTLAMAATCMPDIMAMTFGMWGMDRILPFSEERRWPPGAAAGRTAGARRSCAAPVPRPCCWWRRCSCGPNEWDIAPRSLALGAGGGAGGGQPRVESRSGGRRDRRRRFSVAHLDPQCAAQPGRVSRLPGADRRHPALCAALAGTLALRHGGGDSLRWASRFPVRYSLPRLLQYAVPAALCCLLSIACARVADDWRSVLPLLVWLGSGLVALPYVHMAAKYLLPGVPAAALLIVLHAARRASSAIR